MLPRKKRQRGFTLVELMVVMAILAVLSAIVVPAVTGTKTAGEHTQRLGDERQVQTAVQSYITDDPMSAAPEVWISDPNDPNYDANWEVWGLTPDDESTTPVTLGEKSIFTADKTLGTSKDNYTLINFDASHQVDDMTLSFVPDYLPDRPTTAEPVGAPGTTRDFIWALLVGEEGNRTAQLFQINDARTAYVLVE